MRHWENLAVKFLVVTAVIWLVGSVIDGLTFGRAVVAGVIVTLILYFLWDLYLLPSIGNVATAIADGATAAVILAVMDRLMAGYVFSFWGLVTIGAVLAIGEFFLHRWFVNKEQPGEKT